MSFTKYQKRKKSDFGKYVGEESCERYVVLFISIKNKHLYTYVAWNFTERISLRGAFISPSV